MKRGDVVMVDWIYSDRTGSKIRPALVVQADFLNQLIDDTILLAITRTSRHASATEVVIDPVDEPQSGLRFLSVISCNNILTLDQTLIVKTIGQLSDAVMQKVDDGLRTVLELP